MIKFQLKKYCFPVILVFGIILELHSCQNSTNCGSLSPGLFGSFHGRGSGGDTVYNLFVKGIGAQVDTLIYDTLLTGKIKLDLRPNSDTTKFYMKFKFKSYGQLTPDYYTDTMTVICTRQMNFLGTDCGFITYFTINKIATSKNDSINVLIRNPTVNADNTENIWINF